MYLKKGSTKEHIWLCVMQGEYLPSRRILVVLAIFANQLLGNACMIVIRENRLGFGMPPCDLPLVHPHAQEPLPALPVLLHCAWLGST